MSGFPTNGAGLSSETRIGLPIGIDSHDLLPGEFLARDSTTGELRRFAIPPTSTQPYLRGVAPMVPVSGDTMVLKQANVSNGTDTQTMARWRVAITDDVHIYAPIWAGWGAVQSADPVTNVTVMSESDTPNDVRVSAAVETLDGRLFRLSAAGSRRWTVPPGARIQCDPIDIDVKASDGYFWLRVYAEVTAGGVWWKGHYVATSITGQNIVNYANDLTLVYDTSVMSFTPSLYWKLNLVKLANDQSGGGHNGTAVGGATDPPTIGIANGVFGSNDATQFDGFDDRITSTYNPFVNAQPLSIVGIAYRDNSTTADSLIGGSDITHTPDLRINANVTDVQFMADATGTAAVWTAAWPGNGQWVHWALVFDEAADTVELFINGVSQGVKTSYTAQFNASSGNFQVGSRATTVNPFAGRIERVAVYANTKLTSGNVTTLFNAFLTGAADQTSGTGTLLTVGATSTGSDVAYGPVLHTGTINPLIRKPLVAIWGDSIAEGRNDGPDPTEGFITKALKAAGIPSVKLAKGSERGLTQTSGLRVGRRLGLSDGATHVVYQHTVNDYRSASFAAVFCAITTVLNCSRLAARGAKCFATTIIPGAQTTTDFWATVANQTPNTNDAWRVGYNDWLRAGAPLVSTTITTSSALNASTLNVASTTGFPASGYAMLAGVPVSYAGKTSTTLTGCTALIGGSEAPSFPQPSAATLATGTQVLCVPVWVATVPATGQTLPLATVTLRAGSTTTGFANSGTLTIGPSQTVTYTGLTSTSFTGCSGGTGGIGLSMIQQNVATPANAILSGQPGHPLTGYFEVADTVESSRNSGKWIVNGTANWATTDGIHPEAVAHALMAAGIDTSKITL